MTINKQQVAAFVAAIDTNATDKAALLTAAAAATGTDRPEDAASCCLEVLRKLSASS